MTKNKIRIREIHAIIREVFPKLQILKEQDNQTAFKDSIGKILPGVRSYITVWLNNAINNDKIPKGKYKVDDFVDELYIMAYDRFQEVKSDKDFRKWLFKKADELFEDTEIEEDFDDFFFKNIDDYTKAEWEEMEEKFSVDGDGDLVMEDELDDLSYAKNDYILEDVFVEDGEEKIIEKLNKKLNDEQINRHINLVLHHLPVTQRTVFDLAIRQIFELEDIAEIKQVSVKKVEEYLSYARNSIQISFSKRYSF